MVKLPNADETEEVEDKKGGMNEQTINESSSRSPQKSLAITKGPQRAIPQSLELDSYKAVEVKEIQIKQINQSVVQIRAHKELSSMNSIRKLGTSSAHDQNSQANISQNQSQGQNIAQQISQPMDVGSATRVVSADTMNDEQRKQRKSITEVIHDLITTRSLKDDKNEISLMKIENDMVTTFFDIIDQFSDQFVTSFIEELKKDIDNITQTIYASSNELAIFSTYLVILLRRLNPMSGSFYSTLQFCKTLARKVQEDQDSPKDDFFTKHLYRCYLQVIKEDPAKRSYICELLHAHTQHDLTLRIKIVQDLKKHIKEEDVLYCCLAYLVQQEKKWNEEWFDVFLYYALIGLSKSRAYVRVYSLNILNTIAKFNIDSIMDITEKVKSISYSEHWEIKAQCLLFASNMLRKLKSYSYLLKKSNEEGTQAKAPIPSPSNAGQNASIDIGAPGVEKLDRNYAKQLIEDNIVIIRNCFNVNAPKSVMKIGLFELQNVLGDFKLLYKDYIDCFITIEQDVRDIVLGKMLKNEEIHFSIGYNSFTYVFKSKPELFDRISMAASLSEQILESQLENLENQHMELFEFTLEGQIDSFNIDSWFKIFSKIKEYLFVAICDQDLYQQALNILSKFFSTDQLKYQIYDDSSTIFVKTIQVLFSSGAEDCKGAFREYIKNSVEGDDHALTNFLKQTIQQFKESYEELYETSELAQLVVG